MAPSFSVWLMRIYDEFVANPHREIFRFFYPAREYERDERDVNRSQRQKTSFDKQERCIAQDIKIGSRSKYLLLDEQKY